MCPHDIEVYDKCGICGIVRAPNETGSRDMRLWRQISTMLVRQPIMSNVDRVSKRKLQLVIDIDGTIVQTTTDNFRRSGYMNPGPDTIDYFLSEDHPNEVNYSSTKRPHMAEFFLKMAEIFDIKLFTLGSRAYAGKMSQFINMTYRKMVYFDHDVPTFFNCLICVDYIGDEFTIRDDPMTVLVHARPEVFGHMQNAVHLRLPVFSEFGEDYLLRLGSVLAGVHERFYNEVDLWNMRPDALVRRGHLPDIRGAMYPGLVASGAQGTGHTANLPAHVGHPQQFLSIAGSSASASELGDQAPVVKVAERMDADEAQTTEDSSAFKHIDLRPRDL